MPPRRRKCGVNDRRSSKNWVRFVFLRLCDGDAPRWETAESGSFGIFRRDDGGAEGHAGMGLFFTFFISEMTQRVGSFLHFFIPEVEQRVGLFLHFSYFEQDNRRAGVRWNRVRLVFLHPLFARGETEAPASYGRTTDSFPSNENVNRRLRPGDRARSFATLRMTAKKSGIILIFLERISNSGHPSGGRRRRGPARRKPCSPRQAPFRAPTPSPSSPGSPLARRAPASRSPAATLRPSARSAIPCP
jgi:hypothetical protein